MKCLRCLAVLSLAILLHGCFKSVVIRPVIYVRDPIPKDAKLDDQRQEKGHPPVDAIRPEKRLRKQ